MSAAAVQMNRKFLAFCRTIHIYLSMLGLTVMLLFGVTGFTVNHEAWFGATDPHVTESTGTLPANLLGTMDRLEIVEHLRKTFHITGAMSGFDVLDDKVSIGFKSPDQMWEVEIDKTTGATSVHNEAFNAIALINNLHRGRYSGSAWKWVIDISAILIVLACMTGVVLWLVLPKRRKIGTAAVVLGTLATVAIYVWLVPGADEAPEVPANPPDAISVEAP